MAKSKAVFAFCSPRSIGGVSLFAAGPITASNVREFYSQEPVIRETTEALRELGFEVHHADSITISFSGSAKRFREQFNIKFQKRKLEVMPGHELEYLAPTVDDAGKLLSAPEPLSKLIEGVAVASPPRLFQSPLPPIVAPGPYRYLLVPDDVGLITRANRVHRLDVSGKGVDVAIVDSGLYRHPYFNWHGYRLKATVLGPGAANPAQDEVGHGTAMAANLFATAPDANLLPVKLKNPDAKGAFDVAVAQNPHIISLSWGLGIDGQSWAALQNANPNLYNYAKGLEASVANAVATGIVVCAAAGNRGVLPFPASHPDVVAVGGVHVHYPDLDLEASSYASSFASQLYPGRQVPDLCGLCGNATAEVTAPLIMLPVPPDSPLDLDNSGSKSDGWSLFSGTSSACPQVAGVAALLLEKNPNLTPAEIKNILIRSARDVQAGSSFTGDAAAPGTDDATGAGLVDAKWAWLFCLMDLLSELLQKNPGQQAEMVAAGVLPRLSPETLADVVEILRSR